LNTAVDQVCGWAALAAQETGSAVTGAGVMEVNWVQRVPRRSALA
jgi:hypothetical protein